MKQELQVVAVKMTVQQKEALERVALMDQRTVSSLLRHLVAQEAARHSVQWPTDE